jgi:hypothetical protein
VGGFLINIVPQEQSGFLYVNVQEGKVAIWLSLHGELNVGINVEMIIEIISFGP